MTGDEEMAAPPWQVLLLGGASGVGKTSISYRLAQHYRAGLTEVDDFQIILERMTTEEQYPDLHYWRAHRDEALRLDEAGMLDRSIRYARTMATALELVIANHIETRTPVVLEGDFILPELALRPVFNGIPADGQVRALFIHEADEAQIALNYQFREGKEQPRRARISWWYSEWLRAEAERLGVPALPARPWDTALERAIALVDHPMSLI
jgi:2-phosphoglycerate kinase